MVFRCNGRGDVLEILTTVVTVTSSSVTSSCDWRFAEQPMRSYHPCCHEALRTNTFETLHDTGYDIHKACRKRTVGQLGTWSVLPMVSLLLLKAVDVASNSREIADFGRLQPVLKDWRSCFELFPLDVELRHVEHKYVSYFCVLRLR